MGPTYYIYSTKMFGWINKIGTAGTNRREAKPFTYDEAITYCRDRVTHEGAATCFPVETAMIDSVEQKL